MILLKVHLREDSTSQRVEYSIYARSVVFNVNWATITNEFGRVEASVEARFIESIVPVDIIEGGR